MRVVNGDYVVEKNDTCTNCNANSMLRRVDKDEYREFDKTDAREFESGEHALLCVFCQGLADRDSFGVEEFGQYFDDVEDEPMRDLDRV